MRLRLHTVAGLALALCLLTAPLQGCAASTAADGVGKADLLYAGTLGEIDDLREAGLVDAATYHNVVTPLRKTVYASLQKAQKALAAGDTNGADVALQAADAAMLQLQAIRNKAKPLQPSLLRTPPGINPRTTAVPPPLQAAIDPISAAVLLLGLISRYGPIAAKLVRGEALTEQELADAQAAADAETARADALDAQAATELGQAPAAVAATPPPT